MLSWVGWSSESLAVSTMKPSSLTRTPATTPPSLAQRNRTMSSACHATAAASVLHRSFDRATASRNTSTVGRAVINLEISIMTII